MRIFIISMISLFSVNMIISQKTVSFSEIPKKSSKFDTYITRSKDTISIGDTITLGLPSSDIGFRYVTQGGMKCADFLASADVEITRIRTFRNRFSGKVYLEFKGYGLLPLLIDYETALKIGEIENPF